MGGGRDDDGVQKRVLVFLLLISVGIIFWASLVSARSLPRSSLADATPTKVRARVVGEDRVEHLRGRKSSGRFGELVRLGSRPPNCEHKCGGCEPCVAIQVPATRDQRRPQYANYEPEGWKCKCGSSFSNP